MKYFTYNLLCAANGWDEDADEEQAGKDWDVAVASYWKNLEELKDRVSRPAWEFFRYGREEKGLHDGRLISAAVGDGLDFTPAGASPFRLNRQKLNARIVFLNYEQSRLYTFDLRGVESYENELFVEEWRYAKSVGDLYLLELSAVDDKLLQLGFLFASGANIAVQFRRLVFRRKIIDRKYDQGAMYS